MTLTPTMKVTPSQARTDKILNYAADPKRRAVAARLLNTDAKGMVRIAQEIADDEFRQDRVQSRRPEDNRGKPHYVNSFTIKPATVETLQRMVVVWGNSHPAANIIEHGARPHVIASGMQGSGTGPGFQRGRLKFPFRPPPGSGNVNTPGGPPGTWPPNFGGGARTASIKQVNHPGSPAFHIMRRAIKRYKRRNR